MEEIIAKSKAFKAAKQMQREDDLAATEKLDAAFHDLMEGDALRRLVRPKGTKPLPTAAAPVAGASAADAAAAAADAAADKQYDVLRRELVFERKAVPGERTRTAEELAEAEGRRLEVIPSSRP